MNTDLDIISQSKETIFQKMILSVWGVLVFYCLFYGFLNAWFAVGVFGVGAFVLTPLVYLIHKYCSENVSKLFLSLPVLCISILAVSALARLSTLNTTTFQP